MANPYLGEIRLVAFNFAPIGWALCNGAAVGIAQYASLYNLIGTTYGGDGQASFQLPDLQGRVPVHMNATFSIGRSGGAESVTLSVAQMPAHNHGSTECSDAAATSSAPIAGGIWAVKARNPLYLGNAPSATMASGAIANAGSNLPHENRQPSLALNYIIAVAGIYPSSN